MLNKMILKNYKPYEDMTIEFNAGLNIFTGDSDAGKSAFFSAFKWVCFNKPDGTSMISFWALHGLTSATLYLSSGFQIIREKGKDTTGKNINQYRLIDPVGKVEIFSALRGSVPDAVKKALNLSEINFRSQRELPFLIGNKNAGEAAKIINVVLGNTRSDEIIARAKKEEKQLSNLQTLLESEAADSEKKFQLFSNFEQLKSRYTELVQRNSELEKLKLKIEKLNMLCIKYTECKTVMEKFFGIPKLISREENLRDEIEMIEKRENGLKTLFENLQKMEKMEAQSASLRASKTKIEAYGDDAKSLSRIGTQITARKSRLDALITSGRILSNARRIPAMEALFARFAGISDKWRAIGATQTRIVEILRGAKSLEMALETPKTIGGDIDRMTAKKVALRAELPAICPVCGCPDFASHFNA